MILIFILCLVLTAAQVSHQPIVPQVVTVKFSDNIRTVPSATAFKASFPALGYEIGGAVYETHKGLLSDEVFNRQSYEISRSCHLYRSQLNLQLIRDISLSSGQSLESVAASAKLGVIFSIISDNSYSEVQAESKRTLVRFQFNKTSLASSNKSILVSDLGLNNSELIDIRVLMVGDVLVVTDGIKFIGIDPNNFDSHWEMALDLNSHAAYDYKFASENDLINFKLSSYDRNLDVGIVLTTWGSAMRIFNVSDKGRKVTMVLELVPPDGTSFTDAVPQYGKYWALAGGKFVAFRPTSSGKFQVRIVELQSAECFQLNKYQTTLHIICKEGGLNYVGEYYLNQAFDKPQDALKLNRYYNQIDDARFLFRFGGDYSPKLIISGDNQLLLVPYAVNRQALLESSYPPKANRIRSLGIELIFSLPQFSNFTHNYALGVAQSFLTLFVIIEDPPEMECFIRRTNEDIRWNILVQLNTSSCLANGDWEQLESICSYKMPFTLYASVIEVDAANHPTIVVTILLLLLAVGIVVVGCGLYCKTQIQRAAGEVKKRIAALRKKKEMKPI